MWYKHIDTEEIFEAVQFGNKIFPEILEGTSSKIFTDGNNFNPSQIISSDWILKSGNRVFIIPNSEFQKNYQLVVEKVDSSWQELSDRIQKLEQAYKDIALKLDTHIRDTSSFIPFDKVMFEEESTPKETKDWIFAKL